MMTSSSARYWPYVKVAKVTLRWRHNDHAGVSNHQFRDCLLNRLFRRRSKKTSKLRVTGLCAENSPGPVNSPHAGPVTRKMFPFDDVNMQWHGVLIFFSLICDWTHGWEKHTRRQWFETPSRSCWRHCNVLICSLLVMILEVMKMLIYQWQYIPKNDTNVVFLCDRHMLWNNLPDGIKKNPIRSVYLNTIIVLLMCGVSPRISRYSYL